MFVRGGNVGPGVDLGDAGSRGFYWSSDGRNSSNAYGLLFYSGYVTPSHNAYRYYGRSVRCVALGG